MLISKNYQKNDVVTVKLVTGEELIGYYEEHDDTHVTMRKPVVPVPTQQGSVGLAPYLMSSDYMTDNEKIMINGQAVVTISKTNKSFADAYSQQVSGLDMSTSSNPGLITA
jgi:hypothetical protein